MGGPQRHPALPSALFDGDPSPLRRLYLEYVRAELPLTSFTLVRTLPLPVRRIFDFLESAPHLRKVGTHSEIQTSGVHIWRLVSMACLKRMDIAGGESSSPLPDHLLVTVDALPTI